MDPASLAIGSLGTAELCIKFGKKLAKLYHNYKDAEVLVAELLLHVQNKWLRTEAQLDLTNKIWYQLPDNLKAHQSNLLQVLQGKLEAAYADFDNIIGAENAELSMNNILRKGGNIRKVKYAVAIEKHLGRTIKELDNWHSLFDLSWWLTIRISEILIDEQLNPLEEDKSARSGSVVSGDLTTMRRLRTILHNAPNDMELHHGLSKITSNRSASGSDTTLVASTSSSRSSVFVPASTIGPGIGSTIPFSCCREAKLAESGRAAIVDVIRPDERIKAGSMIESVRNLARVLSSVDTMTFGLLACEGVIKVEQEQGSPARGTLIGYDFILQLPPCLSNPRSLRSVLLDEDLQVPLDEWMTIARTLAKSVVLIHASQFVHKNIRPETILVLQSGTMSLGLPFLTGFTSFRVESSQTHMYGDKFWERNLYRHPRRQGLHPEESYCMQHDIYSLGVVLLEIALRTSFVLFGKGSFQYPNPILEIKHLDTDEWSRLEANSLKEHLVVLAKTQLPAIVGSKYSQTVVACLSCLDENNDEFGDESEFQDEDGVLVGVRYIEKIIVRLEEISV